VVEVNANVRRIEVYIYGQRRRICVRVKQPNLAQGPGTLAPIVVEVSKTKRICVSIVFRPIRMDHTNCLQVAIKTLQKKKLIYRKR
jgi:hypothetical protein